MALTWAVFHGLLLILNWCLTVIGICIMICGAVLEDYIRNLDSYLDSKFHAAPILMIIAGIMIFVAAWMGLCGGVFFSFVILLVAGIALIIFLICLVAAGALALAYRQDYDAMKLSRIDEWGADYTKHSREVDSMHRYLSCCSVEGDDLPKSCCRSNSGNCQQSSGDLFNKDCKSRLKEFIHTEAIVIAVVAFVFAMFTTAVILIDICVANVVKEPPNADLIEKRDEMEKT